MKLFFKDAQIVLRLREGPLDQWVDSYTARHRAERTAGVPQNAIAQTNKTMPGGKVHARTEHLD